MLDCELFGVNPGPQHVVNVIFHGANVALLFLWLTSLTGRPLRSGAVAMLFAWHPLQVDTVAWIAERKNLLSAMFWILALWAYTRWTRRRRSRDYLAALALYATGLMCKPAIVTLPCVMLLLDFWPLKRLTFPLANPAKILPPLLIEKIPFFALTIASSWITIHAHVGLGNLTSTESIPFLARVGNALASYALYARNVFWPMELSIVYPLVTRQPPALILAGVFAVLAPLVFALKKWRERSHLLVGWLWFLGTLVPTIGIVQAGHQSMADRFAYIAVIGIFIAVVWLAADAAGASSVLPRHRLLAAACVGLGCLGLTTRQIDYWRDSKSLFERALAVTPRNWIARNVLGADCIRRRELEKALEHLTEAERLYPSNPDIHYNLGLALVKTGRFAEAESHYATALRLYPRYVLAMHGMGFAAMLQRRLPEAKEWFQRALAIEPSLSESQGCLDLIARGATEDFITLNKVEYELAQHPSSIDLRLRAAELLSAIGRHPEAAAHYEKILAEKPDDARALAGLGATHAAENRDADAIPFLERALAAQTNLAEAHLTLGTIRERASNTTAALAHFRAATGAKPDLAPAWTSIGHLQARLGNTAAALDAYEHAAKLCSTDSEAQMNAGLAAANLQRAPLANRYLREAARLRPDWPPPLNALAWLLATHPDSDARNGAAAVNLARRACELTSFQNASYLDVFAAALAETGDFQQAVAIEEKSASLAQTSAGNPAAAEFQARLKLYKSGVPFRQPRSANAGP
jgi:tetratricopeptide (TPR) repeat protein